ncbi:uncharacterized protein [Procambarus clarkii]|uniref:uncharacterized protein n=1 Tax=Procambarus clarkii TaxID=6728 RepID=UPI003743D8F5
MHARDIAVVMFLASVSTGRAVARIQTTLKPAPAPPPAAAAAAPAAPHMEDIVDYNNIRDKQFTKAGETEAGEGSAGQASEGTPSERLFTGTSSSAGATLMSFPNFNNLTVSVNFAEIFASFMPFVLVGALITFMVSGPGIGFLAAIRRYSDVSDYVTTGSGSGSRISGKYTPADYDHNTYTAYRSLQDGLAKYQ